MFIFTALKDFIKPLEAPQRNVNLKFKNLTQFSFFVRDQDWEG